MKVLLLTPPMTQLNTPYPATAYLTGFLRKNGYLAVQEDPALELALKLFSKAGLREVVKELEDKNQSCSRGQVFHANPVQSFLAQKHDYIKTVDSVVRFLQGKDPSLALRIVGRNFLPEGPRFLALNEGANPNDPDPIYWAFGSLGIQDRAKYLASLYIDDVVDVITHGIDNDFQFSKYGEKLAASVPSFEPLSRALKTKSSLVDRYLDELTEHYFEKHQPDIVGISAPFPGNVYGAFRIAKKLKSISPQTKILFGGGYVNTELRQLSETEVFDYMDYITLDDGERPILQILESLKNADPHPKFLRTFVREGNAVVFKSASDLHDIPHKDIGTPTYDGLPLDRYLSLFEMLNPVHRIWSDGRWNKLTLAHGCYWKKCNFCDVTLDYIGRYNPASIDILMERIEKLIEETGQTGFHFVDEAAPPAVLKSLAEKLLEREISITWWGNVRFDKTFTPELCDLLARSGCVILTGGLEVASDRLLKLMQKGITVEQVARVTRAMTDAGIMVHAYLMYGFPTQTEQETVDALERVRQLFEAGCLQSAHWHRFSATAHSPIGLNPEKFGIEILTEPKVTFARNDLAFSDPTRCDHDRLGEGLRRALYNYMHGTGFDMDIREWFGRKGNQYRVPKTQVPRQLIQRALSQSLDLRASRM